MLYNKLFCFLCLGGDVLKKENNIHNEIKGNLSLNGWKFKEVINEMNRRRKLENRKLTTESNILNKIRRETIKYTEVKEIADIIGCNLEWKKK